MTQLEAAFARIKQAYDTLRDDGLRANYNAKLAARKKTEPLAESRKRPRRNRKSLSKKWTETGLSATGARRPGAVRGWRATKKPRRAAEAELLAAIKLDPGNAEYRVMLAELYRDLGLKLRAKGEAERAVAADPNNRKARDLLKALKSV